MHRELILMLLLICTIGGYVVLQNHRVNSAQDRALRAEDTASRLQAELDESRLNVRVVTRYVDRVQVVKERGKTITREIPIHVTKQADARCDVPAGFVRVHDAAAQDMPIDQSAGDPDAPAPGLTLSSVADTVAGNYAACHETREQMIALQEYLRGLQEIAP